MRQADRFRAQCRVLRVATLLVFAGLGLLFLVGATGAPWLFPARAEAVQANRALLMLIVALPALGYLWALWAAQQALGDLAAGRLFHVTVARAMRRMGIGVLVGALLNVFVVVNLGRWVIGSQGSYVYFDLSGIVLGVVGAALILLARLVDQARVLQAELDEIL